MCLLRVSLLCVPALALRVPAACALAVRVCAVRLRAGHVPVQQSSRSCALRSSTSSTSRGYAGLCFVLALCMIALCALAFPMLALRAPAVRALAVRSSTSCGFRSSTSSTSRGCAGPYFLLACCEHGVLVQFVVDMCVLVVLEPMPAARANAVRANAVRLRAGRVVRLCSVRLDRADFACQRRRHREGALRSSRPCGLRSSPSPTSPFSSTPPHAPK